MLIHSGKKKNFTIYFNIVPEVLANTLRWTYLYGRKGDADVENGHAGTEEEGKGRMNWESYIKIKKEVKGIQIRMEEIKCLCLQVTWLFMQKIQRIDQKLSGVNMQS